MLWAFWVYVCVVVSGRDVSRPVGAIKVSRTLGQSQLNFAHTFFGALSLTRPGCYQGSRRSRSRKCSKDPVLGHGDSLVASPNVAFALK